MNIREWALLVFTILGQLAVGMLLVLMIVRAYAIRRGGLELADRLTDRPLYVVAPVMIVGLLAALLHLGKLLHVIGAIPNLGTSWMSREVVFAVVFVIAAALFTLLQWRKMGTDSLRTAIGWIAAALGLVYIYCMSMTYMLPTQPAWNTLATPITFFVASLLLGVLGTAAALTVNYPSIQVKPTQKASVQEDVLRVTYQWIAVAAIVLLGMEFLVIPLYLVFLSTQGSAALVSLHLMIGTYGLAFFFRLLLVIAGAGVVVVYLFRSATVAGQEKALATLAYSAFVLVLLGEILARFLFYATRFRIGV
jgi:anaerobic dimethyl sulfoxide reductase subunit C (anchor subunit)